MFSVVIQEWRKPALLQRFVNSIYSWNKCKINSCERSFQFESDSFGVWCSVFKNFNSYNTWKICSLTHPKRPVRTQKKKLNRGQTAFATERPMPPFESSRLQTFAFRTLLAPQWISGVQHNLHLWYDKDKVCNLAHLKVFEISRKHPHILYLIQSRQGWNHEYCQWGEYLELMSHKKCYRKW